MKCKTMIAGYIWIGEMHMDLLNSSCADGDEWVLFSFCPKGIIIVIWVYLEVVLSI